MATLTQRASASIVSSKPGLESRVGRDLRDHSELTVRRSYQKQTLNSTIHLVLAVKHSDIVGSSILHE